MVSKKLFKDKRRIGLAQSDNLNKMRGIFRSIFIGLVLLAWGGMRAWGVTPEFIDSLRTELGRRNIPERILFLPLALADQRFDDGREGIWSLTALDAIRGRYKSGEAIPRPEYDVTDSGRDGGMALDAALAESADAGDSTDIRFDARISTEIALDRLQELFNEYGDWNMSIVAFATSPTALAVMDSTALADARILRSLRKAEEEYSENIPEAFERIGALAAQRKAERSVFLQEQAALRKARLDSLRKRQAANSDRITYTIRRGDTLGGIAVRYRVKVSDLKRWNNLSGDMIREGRKLVIYK